jgi:uncharacterized protein with PQ loop repeat
MDRFGIYCESSRVAFALANLILSVGLFTQCWRLYRTKNTKGLTVALFATLALHRMVQLNYGFAINEWPSIAAGLINVPPILLIAIGYFLYRKRPAEAAESQATTAADDWTWSESPTVRMARIAG